MMIRTFVLTVLMLFMSLMGLGQKPAYQIYTKEGKPAVYQDILSSMSDRDILLFGELHNNAIAHWLELEVAKDLSEKYTVALGAEMYEADDQIVLDEYLNDLIKYKHFKTEAKVWPNNETDYQPLVDLAKEKGLRFIATNIPRRYANLAARKGTDTLKALSKDAKRYIAPLPIEVDMNLNCYKQFIDMGMAHGEMTPEKMAKSQASKDATMAYFITENMPKDGKFIHYNGAYHSDNFESICYYINKYNKKLTFITITTVEVDDISKFPEDSKGQADFILVVDEDVTKTY